MRRVGTRKCPLATQLPTRAGAQPSCAGARSNGHAVGVTEQHPTALQIVAGHDLAGRDAIVTGGASGIGVETVRALATAGARVVIATRDVSRAQPVAEQLRQHTGNNGVAVAPLDLASLASVRRFVDMYLSTARALHVLINNAGIMAGPLTYTEDGFELQFATNHLGHHALTVGLLPALRATDESRVVALTSIGHRRGDVDFDDPDFRVRPYDPWIAYAQSKTANALFAVGMTCRYQQDGITTNAVAPGFIWTRLQRHMTRAELHDRGWVDESGTQVRRLREKTVEQGAATSVWAAVAPELSGDGGHYLEDCAIAESWTGPGELRRGYLPYALDPEHAERLWAITAERIKAGP